MKATLSQECRNDKLLWVTNSTHRSQQKAISHSNAHRLVILLLQTPDSSCRCRTQHLPPPDHSKAGFTPYIHTLPGLSQSRARGWSVHPTVQLHTCSRCSEPQNRELHHFPPPPPVVADKYAATSRERRTEKGFLEGVSSLFFPSLFEAQQQMKKSSALSTASSATIIFDTENWQVTKACCHTRVAVTLWTCQQKQADLLHVSTALTFASPLERRNIPCAGLLLHRSREDLGCPVPVAPQLWMCHRLTACPK